MTITYLTASDAAGRTYRLAYDPDGGGVMTITAVTAGTVGTSYSANLPTVGAGLGTLLATVPANPDRGEVLVENQSAGDLIVVGDDGAGGNIWMSILVGVAANSRGGDWSSRHFRGRIRVYGASGARVSAVEF